MTIRVGVTRDVAHVLTLERALVTAPHWPVTAYEDAASQARLFVAEEEGELVGFAVGALIGEEGELETLGVRQDAQRKGIGRALMEEVLGWMDGRPVMLEVRAENLGARLLYEKFGFVQVGLRQSYYAAPEEDAVVMRRTLDTPSGASRANALSGE